MSAGQVTSVNVDTNQSDKLLRLLDTVVIKLEGGTDEDLKVLDEKPNIEYKPEPPKEPSVIVAAVAKTVIAQSITESKTDTTEANLNDEDSGEVKEIEPNATNDINATDKIENNVDEKPSKKRKRTTSGSSSSSSSSTSSSGKLKIVFFHTEKKKHKQLFLTARFSFLRLFLNEKIHKHMK